MKTYLKIICLVTVLAFVIGACSPAAAPPPVQEPVQSEPVVDLPEPVAEQPKPVVEQPKPEPTQPPAAAPQVIHQTPPLLLLSKKVAELPKIDGKNDDPQWADAPPLWGGSLEMRAVHTDTDFAILMKWPKRTFAMNSDETWTWDSAKGVWESKKAKLGGDWFSIGFNINNDAVQTDGCNAFCHEYPEGSGIFHHQTGVEGAYVDTWMLMRKHGFGAGDAKYDIAWFGGVDGIHQEGDLIFDTTNPRAQNNVLAGNVTYYGYAEGNTIGSPNDPKYSRNRPRDAYCQDCHDTLQVSGRGGIDPLVLDATYPVEGEPMYYGNRNADITAPLYMKKDPKNYVDAMVITQEQIDNGEAVAIADLSKEEIDKYWENYVRLNAVVPVLILKQPTGPMADVKLAANWTNGYYTLEMTRKLVTGNDDQVQFDDFSKDYFFALTNGGGPEHIRESFVDRGALLRFEQ